MRTGDDRLPLDQPRIMHVPRAYWRNLLHVMGSSDAAKRVLDAATARKGFDRWEVNDDL